MQLHNWRELEDGFVKYMAYVASSGLHGAELYKAACQYWKPSVEKALIEQDKATRSACAEVARGKVRSNPNPDLWLSGWNTACNDIALSLEANGLKQ